MIPPNVSLFCSVQDKELLKGFLFSKGRSEYFVYTKLATSTCRIKEKQPNPQDVLECKKSSYFYLDSYILSE